MKTSLVILVLAPAWAIVLNGDAGPSTYDDLICQSQNGSPGFCTQAANCNSASGTQQKCSVDGLICCEKPGLKHPPDNIGQKSHEACLKSSEIDKVTECAPLQIIPGKNFAVENQFPYMVALGYGNKSETQWVCSGVLISEKYVLTTALCALPFNLKNDVEKRVHLGDFVVRETITDPNAQEIEVEKVIPHPLFNYTSLYHDIALLKLVSDTKFSARVRPACLNALPELPVNKVIAAGFVKSFTADEFRTLRYVDLDEVPADECNKLYKGLLHPRLKEGVNHSSICAIANGRDTCGAGEALQVRLDEPYCQYSVVGLSSFGPRDCTYSPLPGVYTRVSEHLQWIESIVWS